MPPSPTARTLDVEEPGKRVPSRSDITDTVRAAETIEADICVIGAGCGGLTVASAAAAVGQRVVLVEKHRMGGGSLNYGAVPSKALLAAARAAQSVRSAYRLGVTATEPTIDLEAVRAHIYQTLGSIAQNASLERFTAMGVRVVPAAARFLDKRTIEAGDLRIRARRFVIATGSSPDIPNIPGLDNIAFFTNETIFDNARPLERLVVLGGGSSALEIALAYRWLGSAVTVIAPQSALPDEDPELAAVALRGLRAQGIDLREGVSIDRLEPTRQGLRVVLSSGGTLDATHLLVAGDRRPNVSDLNLGAAGVKAGVRGISVNSALRSSNRRVYAIGDVTGLANYSHAATYQAGVVLKRMLFRLRTTQAAELVPRLTVIEPEMAWVGLDENGARARYKRIRVLRSSFAENDKARADDRIEGHIKVLTNDRDVVLGAGIVGPCASELIQVWALAIAQKLTLRDMTACVAAYPTYSGISQQVAAGRFAASAGNPLLRVLVRLLGRLG